MKILIVGSTGMLGSTLKQYLNTVKINYSTLDRDELDLSKCSYSELESKVIKKNCNILINCAGIIKQRKNALDSDFVSVNSLLPHRLFEICENNNIQMIHITTDCVFNGIDGNYNELSFHNANDLYGKSKSLGEPIAATVIRTSIIGEEINNKLSLLEWVKSNKNNEINGYTNHLWNGVTCLQLSKLIVYFILNKKLWCGIKHIYSNVVSKYELIELINEIYNLNIKINTINDKTNINRTLTSIYNLEYNIPPLKEQIKDMYMFHNKNENYN